MVTFKTERVSERITRIFGTSGELWYLVEGDREAALLDSGSGLGHMKPLVERLTEKPLIILLTHGHVDHAMGATEFDCPIYMNPADDAIYEEHKDYAVRTGGLMMDPEIRDAIEDSDYIPARTEPFLPLHHGDTFDLGGLTIEVFDCAGHTPGSMVFLLREERTVLLGDACNVFTFLFFPYSTTVEAYGRNLRTLRGQLAGKADKVLLSHGDGNAPMGILDGVIDVCDDILQGRVDNIPFQFKEESAFIAKDMSRVGIRADGGIGNIVYNPDRIFEA